MANRAVWGPLPGGGFGVRISRPGKNVLDPNLPPKDVAFDTNWLADSKVLIRGVVTRPQVVYFGQTLPYLPKTFFLREQGGPNQWRLLNDWDSFEAHGPGRAWEGAFETQFAPLVYRDRIDIRYEGTTRISYIVLRD